MLNGATQLAITKLDTVFPACQSAKVFEKLPAEARRFVEEVEQKTGVRAALIGTGPDALDIIDRR